MDAAIIYCEGPVERREIESCRTIYRSSECRADELYSEMPKEKTKYFGVRSLDEKVQAMIQGAIEKLDNRIQHLENENKAMKEAMEEESKSMKEENKAMKEENKAMKKESDEKIEQLKWDSGFTCLYTTPQLLLVDRLLALSRTVQKEFTSTLKFFSVKVPGAEQSPLEKLCNVCGDINVNINISGFAWNIHKMIAEGTADDETVKLAEFIVEHALAASFSGVPDAEACLRTPSGADLLSEWMEYRKLADRRNKGGHPSVQQGSDLKEVQRVKDSEALFEKLVKAPKTRFVNSNFADPNLDFYPTLITLSLIDHRSVEPPTDSSLPRADSRTPPTKESPKYSAVNLWLEPDLKKRKRFFLPDLFGSNKHQSVLQTPHRVQADVAVILSDDNCLRKVEECLLRGIRKILIVSDGVEPPKVETIREHFRDFKDPVLHHTVEMAGLEDSEFKSKLSHMLARLECVRPSRHSLFRMVVSGVSSNGEVQGRVERGTLKKTSRLVLENVFIDAMSAKGVRQALDEEAFSVERFKVLHLHCSVPEPGTMVQVLLKHPPTLQLPVPGSILSDFRGPLQPLLEFTAHVRVPSWITDDLQDGEYQLQTCVPGSSMKYRVRISWISEKVIRPGKIGDVRVEAGEGIPLVPLGEKVFANYGLNLFKLSNCSNEGSSSPCCFGRVIPTVAEKSCAPTEPAARGLATPPPLATGADPAPATLPALDTGMLESLSAFENARSRSSSSSENDYQMISGDDVHGFNNA